MAKAGWIEPRWAKHCARWVGHLEHGGGGVVGIEYILPHYFSGFALATIAAIIVVVRLIAGVNEELA